MTTFYAPQSGGVKTYLDAKMKALANRDVVHRLVVPGERHETDWVGNSRVYRLRSPSIPFSPGYRMLTSVRGVGRILETERPDIVEVGSPFMVPFLVRRARGCGAFRTVGFYHSDLLRTYVDPYVGRFGKSARQIGRRVARRFIREVYGDLDATVAASRSVSEELRAMGLRNVVTIPLGVDLDLFHPSRCGSSLRRRLGVPEGRPLALFAGRLVRDKGLPTLVEAHGRLPVERRPHLVLVGKGALREKLADTARRRARLSLLEYVNDRERIADIYAISDFYVAPGPGETFGLSIAEAMASGLPVVCVDEGAGPDRLANSGCGRFYETGDAESCATALARMAEEVSPGLRKRARDHAERELGWDRTFRRLDRLYRELIRKAGRFPPMVEDGTTPA